MKNILAAATAASILAMSAQALAQQQQSPYASVGCTAGCQYSDNSGAVIYYGSVPRLYRVCSADGYEVTIVVDGRDVKTKHDRSVRQCMDLNAHSIVLRDGKALFGLLP